ncbi:MAG: hypothetical protein QOD26_3792 [Betaproteobacteria bacterium]|jgi:signal transduction histidine kinase|nr:hypothetical protein [Betaproteobacteria bacterium]
MQGPGEFPALFLAREDMSSITHGTMRRFVAPMIVLAVAIAFSLALFAYVRDDLQRDASLRFESQAADAKHIIERRLHSYVGITYGLRALFDARDSLSRAEFHRYVASLNLDEKYPGFVQLNYARHISGSEKRRLEAEVRRDSSIDSRGYPQFAVRPPGNRPDYHVLIYIEPMQGNEFSFGLDTRMFGLRGRAMDNLRESTSLISSGRLLAVGEESFVGLAMRLPVHRTGMPLETAAQRRAAFLGSVGAGLNVRKLMAGVLDETTMTAMRYRLLDAGPIGEARLGTATLLYDSAQSAPGAPRDDFVVPGQGPIFEAVLPLELAGRNWELRFSAPCSSLLQGLDAGLPWLVLAGALICSVLLFAVVHGFASSRERAMKLAGEITRELRESEADLAHAQGLARLGSWTLDLQSDQMAWSAETRRLLELEQGTPRLGAFLSPLVREDREVFRAAAARCVETGVPARLEFGLRLSGTGTRWGHFILQPIEADRAMLRGTIMDVTERKRALEMQRENAAQIRDLLRRLVYAQETERRRFSADLHDLVGQSLSVLGMGIETIRSLLPGSLPQKADQTFTQMGGLLKETMGAVREVMSDLRPPLLDDYGLYAALEWHARQMENRTGLRVEFGGAKIEPRPPAEVEVALFRIAQEALINVAKHAGASQARISLSSEPGRVRLVVEDDGRGIAGAANDGETVGWGMAVMRERAAAVGGSMHVESPGRGTRIVVEVAT